MEKRESGWFEVYRYDRNENQTWVGKYRYAGFLSLAKVYRLFPEGVLVNSMSDVDSIRLAVNVGSKAVLIS